MTTKKGEMMAYIKLKHRLKEQHSKEEGYTLTPEEIGLLFFRDQRRLDRIKTLEGERDMLANGARELAGKLGALSRMQRYDG